MVYQTSEVFGNFEGLINHPRFLGILCRIRINLKRQVQDFERIDEDFATIKLGKRVDLHGIIAAQGVVNVVYILGTEQEDEVGENVVGGFGHFDVHR